MKPKDIQSMQNMYLDDNKDVIRDILIENYQIGNEKDYIKNKDIKNLLENNDIKKDANTVRKIVQSVFEDSEFKENSRINNISIRNFFINLKLQS